MRGFASAVQVSMNLITPNSPAYYLTSVTKDRLPVFRLDKLKSVACDALAEARTSGGFLIFAYVIMPDHLHLISDGEKKPAKVLQFINGMVSRRGIDVLKKHGRHSSLKKLTHEEYRRRRKDPLWAPQPHVRPPTTGNML